jgi:hypothetical protein
MQNSQWQWVPWVVGIAGGGAMGAIINALVSGHRSKRQPIGARYDSISVFRKDRDYKRLTAKLLVMDQVTGQDKEISNLSLARFTLINSGNQDWDNFTFGINLEEGRSMVDVEMIPPDRHHSVTMDVPIPPPDLHQFDFTLRPFNRDDEYMIELYFTYDDEPGGVFLSSPHPTRFVNLRRYTIIAGMVLNSDHLNKVTMTVISILGVGGILGAIWLLLYFLPPIK